MVHSRVLPGFTRMHSTVLPGCKLGFTRVYTGLIAECTHCTLITFQCVYFKPQAMKSYFVPTAPWMPFYVLRVVCEWYCPSSPNPVSTERVLQREVLLLLFRLEGSHTLGFGMLCHSKILKNNYTALEVTLIHPRR